MEKFLVGLRSKREAIIDLILWEICKNTADAAKEVDRTIKSFLSLPLLYFSLYFENIVF